MCEKSGWHKIQCNIMQWHQGKWVTENNKEMWTEHNKNSNREWEWCIRCTHHVDMGMLAKPASLLGIAAPLATAWPELWGPILFIEGNHRALALSEHPSMLQGVFTSRWHVLQGLWCEVPRTSRAIKSPQHKLSCKSRHARIKYVHCLLKVTLSQIIWCSSMHPPTMWMGSCQGIGPKRKMQELKSYQKMSMSSSWSNNHIQRFNSIA